MSVRQAITAAALALSLLAIAILYVSMYAGVSLSGFERAEIVSKLAKVKSENQLLRAQLEQLKSPERLSAIAQSNGMVIADSYERVVLNESIRLAKADH